MKTALRAASALALALCAVCRVEAAPQPVRVMLIGDSLSVGPFGRAMEAALQRRYGSRGVCVFASCGSSPEDWLDDTPVFVTPCGYRQTTPGRSIVIDWINGRRPRPVKTPKLPKILASYRPQLVIVELGTNWMDRLATADRLDGARYREIIRDFVGELRGASVPPPAVVWVMPPASSKYPAAVHQAVDRWIYESGQSLGFRTISSRAITGPYRAGKTGGDGVHYADDAGRRWAAGVMSKLPAAFPLAPAGGGH